MRTNINMKLEKSGMKKLLTISVLICTVALLSARGEEAKVIYEKQCAKCHGPDGKGDTKLGKKAGVKDYTDAKVQAEMKDDVALKAIKEGLQEGDKVKMKPAENVSDADVKALIAYMRTFKAK
jgi:mono/diheme cytochrome c family protein